MDDGLSVDKLNFQTATNLPPNVRLKHAVRTQNLFRHTVSRARSKGMVVNTGKTQMMVVSDSPGMKDEAFIRDMEENEITSTEDMKVLGFYLSSEPSVGRHIDVICRRLRQKYWIPLHLRNYGFSEEELVKVYKSIVRPVADYCSVVYHSMMTDKMDEQLERCQMHALRCIFGLDMIYSKMRQRADITTLRQRRIDQCDKFAASCTKSERFSGWFPKKSARSSSRKGVGETYLEEFARCKRLRDSPIHYMRRRLNGKQGKDYGMRNRERREDGYVGGASRNAWKKQ